MKRKHLLTFIMLLQHLAVAAQIDTLHNKAAIESYLKQKFHYKSIQLREVNSVIKDTVALKATDPKYWLKADFNHDGILDLFVAASVKEGKRGVQDKFLILVSDHNHYSKVDIVEHGSSPDILGYNQTSYSTYAKAGRDYLVMSSLVVTRVRLESKGGWAYKKAYNTTSDTVYVLNSKPMIYTNHPFSQSIESIEFSTTECLGTCPVFELTITKDGSVRYKGIKFVNRIGNFNLRMTPADLTYLTALLAAIDLPRLKEDYLVDYTDAPTAYLTVLYANGQTKNITDYGLQGTYGLMTVYSFLYSLRNF